MYDSTGLTRSQINDLCVRICLLDPSIGTRGGRPPALTVSQSVRVALMYLRRNRAQHDLAEQFEVSQSTISRTISRFVALIELALASEFVPTAEDLDDDVPLLVDGTVVPCWSWKANPELWSGKHRCTGHNIQVATDLDGRLRWVSDPFDGSMHDSRALRDAGFFADPDPAAQDANVAVHVADKGYIGIGLLCPIRKPAHRDLHDTEKLFNKQLNAIRAPVERAIAELKTWRILHTDYRRPLDKFAQTLTAIIALEFFRTAPF